MSGQQAIDQDRKDLQRGVMVNYAGYPLKAAHPVLMVFLVRAYGAEAFGLFVAAQAILLVVTRVCALGLDKALLWWVPQQADGERLRGARTAAIWVSALSVTASAICAVAAGPIAALIEAPQTARALRIMSAALWPMTLLELLLGMSMGTRRMGTNVVVRETVLPMAQVSLGLLLWPLGWGVSGLSWAMVLAYIISLSLTAFRLRALFRGDTDPHQGWSLPDRVWSYAWPMWLAEMANTFLQRLDMWAIAALSDLRTVGIYGVVIQFGNTIRSIRRGYDPIVLAITAHIGAEQDDERLAAGYSYATAMVIGTQLPVLAFFMLFARDLLPLYGAGFDEGALAVVILGAFWVLTSSMSLSGIVVNAFGRSRLALYNVLGAAVVQVVALYLLVPPYGLNGAAIAVGIAYTLQSIVQLLQMRVITGAFHYRSDTAHAVKIGLGTGALLLCGWLLLPPSSPLWMRVVLFAGYAALYLPLFWPLVRRATLATP